MAEKWYDLAKVYRNGLKKLKACLSARDFGHGGVHRSGWWAPLFCFFDTAVNMAIRKYRTFAKKYSFAKLYRVLPKGIRVSLNCLKMLLKYVDIVGRAYEKMIKNK